MTKRPMWPVINLESDTAGKPARRVLDLSLALGVHVLALPIWLILGFLWDIPPGLHLTPAQVQRREIFFMTALAFFPCALPLIFLRGVREVLMPARPGSLPSG